MPFERGKPVTKYTEAQRQKAVGQAVVEGPNRTGRKLGIPHNTISTWMADPKYAGLVERARDEVAAQLWVGIQVGIHAVVDAFADPSATLRDKAIALGVVYDKHALITGGATNRSESRDISGTLGDSELIAAVREADRIARGGGSGTPPTSAPAPEGEGV